MIELLIILPVVMFLVGLQAGFFIFGRYLPRVLGKMSPEQLHQMALKASQFAPKPPPAPDPSADLTARVREAEAEMEALRRLRAEAGRS